jgi:sec-independent protein translocase protein TatC
MTDTADGKMSFLEHLGELRTRIVWSLVPTIVGLLVAFRFSDRMLLYLRRPLDKAGVQLVALTPTEAFWTSMKLSMVAGVVLAMPVILWQVWAFISPGLHRHERRFAAPFVLIGSLLFAIGGAFALLVVVPFALQFLLNFGKEQGIQPMISVSSHVDFIIKFTLAFGLVFELPLALTMLSRMGLVTPKFLSKNRKYAILINFIIAAILTPTPDILNQTLMAGPLIVLYEVGIISARIFGKRRPKVVPAPEETPPEEMPPSETPPDETPPVETPPKEPAA